MSQAQTAQTGKKHGGMFRAVLWIAFLATLLGSIGWLAGLAVGSIIASNGADMFISAQLLNTMGYHNASTAIQAEAMHYIFSANVAQVVFSAIGIAGGVVIGYFKGKREDAEETQ